MVEEGVIGRRRHACDASSCDVSRGFLDMSLKWVLGAQNSLHEIENQSRFPTEQERISTMVPTEKRT
jgi:hypothetical protein